MPSEEMRTRSHRRASLVRKELSAANPKSKGLRYEAGINGVDMDRSGVAPPSAGVPPKKITVGA